MFDLLSILYFMVKSGTFLEKKDNFRHIITISTYTVGLTLSAFSIVVIKAKYHFGISFWICVGTLIAFVLVMIY